MELSWAGWERLGLPLLGCCTNTWFGVYCSLFTVYQPPPSPPERRGLEKLTGACGHTLGVVAGDGRHLVVLALASGEACDGEILGGSQRSGKYPSIAI